MRQANLEAERQLKIEIDLRDYSQAQAYYDQATKLYNETVKPGESDPEMRQLDILFDQLRMEMWIS
jgi:hypothetical protein